MGTMTSDVDGSRSCVCFESTSNHPRETARRATPPSRPRGLREPSPSDGPVAPGPEEAAIDGEELFDGVELREVDPAGIRDLPAVQDERPLHVVREPPVESVRATGRRALPELHHRPHRQPDFLAHLADDGGLLTLAEF